ncbi:putative dUTPase [Erwinia phage pEa_SNUABM_5]|uniref:dUTP diphosphatase n=1 Tax=Erwinia phage pEa_SNUABM_5 TaxID=2797313 RepID=A0A7T8IW13_9CAUD|nr:putative dUTPase [Erwinia phage pEa_SNUABM_5]QQO90453.1 putative dUTPase [Erwinia phage pEa_SNUABM_5]
MQIQIQPTGNIENFIAPKRGSAHAAGLDIFAQEDMLISEETHLFDLGFKAALICPEGTNYVAVLVPRSGSGAKYNVQLSNTLGVIDSDYRGEWKAAIHLGGKGTEKKSLEHWNGERYVNTLEFKRGEAICQMIFIEVPLVDVLVSADELPETGRGDGGFGSTDKPRV